MRLIQSLIIKDTCNIDSNQHPLDACLSGEPETSNHISQKFALPKTPHPVWPSKIAVQNQNQAQNLILTHFIN